MVYNLVTRQQWFARPPTAVVRLQPARVDKFIVHYSGATRTQAVRSIQNFCMDSKGHSDIDYSYLVRGVDLFVGRGDNVGSHTLGNNSTSYGVCIIGNDGDATDADFRTVRTLYDELCARLGRQLRAIGHNQAPGLPANYTSCPGSEIQAWIDAGMPFPVARKVIDMFFLRIPSETPAPVYVSDGVNTRPMPAGTWESTVVPLTNVGVPMLDYATLDDVLKAGGPMVTEPGPVPPLPDTVTVTVPEQTLTVELS